MMFAVGLRLLAKVAVQAKARADIERWVAEHGPIPDGMAWSGEWSGDGTFRGAVLVNVVGFPL